MTNHPVSITTVIKVGGTCRLPLSSLFLSRLPARSAPGLVASVKPFELEKTGALGPSSALPIQVERNPVRIIRWLRDREISSFLPSPSSPPPPLRLREKSSPPSCLRRIVGAEPSLQILFLPSPPPFSSPAKPAPGQHCCSRMTQAPGLFPPPPPKRLHSVLN